MRKKEQNQAQLAQMQEWETLKFIYVMPISHDYLLFFTLLHSTFSPSHILFHRHILSRVFFSASLVKKVYKADIRLF